MRMTKKMITFMIVSILDFDGWGGNGICDCDCGSGVLFFIDVYVPSDMCY